MVSLRDYYKINSFDYGGDINSSVSIGNSDYEIYMEITCCKLNALIEKTKFETMINEIIEADKLKQIISKLETIEEERAESADLLKDAFNEAKSMGFDVKIIKHVLKLRKKDKKKLEEEDNLIDLYRGALGV
jgi:uncharacterized protein (UPF0335 family)